MIPPSWVDLAVVVFVAGIALEATRRGFVAVVLALMRLVLVVSVALLAGPPLADLLTNLAGWSPVWTRPGAFVGLWLLVDLLLGPVTARVLRGISPRVHRSPVNRALALLPGAVQGLMLAAALLSLVSLLPGADTVRRGIARSTLGGPLSQTALAVAEPVAGVFDEAFREAQGFLTVRPPTTPGTSGRERIDLPFRVDEARPDPATEEAMLGLVNQERTQRGLAPLDMDPALQAVARAHAADMFRRGYFAHITPDGQTPVDRIRAARISFVRAGENLALAPTLARAHDGLMNSPGHRAAIIDPGFGRVGIGVLDGGIYGKMFVQVFRD